MPNSIIYN